MIKKLINGHNLNTSNLAKLGDLKVTCDAVIIDYAVCFVWILGFVFFCFFYQATPYTEILTCTEAPVSIVSEN